ncbi:MAG: hypothetical protein R2860_10635 [Desulfobacterales bacterium]
MAVFDFWGIKTFSTTDLIHLRCRGKQKPNLREIDLKAFLGPLPMPVKAIRQAALPGINTGWSGRDILFAKENTGAETF